VALGVTACSGPSSSEKGFATDGSFAFAINSDPGDLNPLTTNIVDAQIVGAYSYDTLLFVDPETVKPEPYLAESWTESPTEVTYTLRDGITCADGAPFTAATAAANLNWILDPANESPRRESVVPADATITVEGNTVTVTTTAPRPFMLYDLGSQQMVCDAGLKEPSTLSAGSNGTGLFQIKDVVAGDSISLTRRDGYEWGPKGTTRATEGVPENVTIKIVPSPSTAANLLRSGGLNAAVVSGKDEARLGELESLSSPTISGMVIYNHNAAMPTADPAVRRALTQAIDLDTLTDILTEGKGERAKSLLGEEPSLCTYDSIKGTLPIYDPAAAAEALAASGAPDVEITLIYDNSTASRSAAAEYVAKQWEEAGAKVTLDGGDENYVIGRTFAAEDPTNWTASLGLILQSGTPAIFPQYLSGPVPPSGTNFAGIDNEAYVKAATAAADLAGEDACSTWRDAEAALFDAADLVPVSMTPFKMYFNGAESIIRPVGGYLPGAAIRVLS
jgi:peptide/nickel transport system substrate-binding protein